MNAFAHKDDKSKINLGNESDLTGIGDGTAFGAIKEINTSLTDKIGNIKIIPILNQNISWSAYQVSQTLDLSSYGVTVTNFIGGIVANLTGSGGSYYISKFNDSLNLVQTNANNTGAYSTTVNYLIFVAT